jgi:hypothetical protein
MNIAALRVFVALATMLATGAAHAFLLLLPLSNLGKPRELQSLIDALERSTQVRALAYAAEPRVFGDRHWVFAHVAGAATQQQAERDALQACRAVLQAARTERVGGELRWDFGDRDCELHAFRASGGAAAVEPAAARAEPAGGL